MGDYKANPNLPLMMRLKFSIGSFLFRFYMRSDGTINRRLFNLLDPKTPAGTTVMIENIPVFSSDISIDPSRDLWFRLFVPETTEKLPLIVYFHGGGFSCFSPKSKAFDDLCRTLSGKIPAVVVSVNYRLAPEHKCPCQYDDGFDALKFINTRNYAVLPANTDVKRCFLAGDSAGGNIAHHVALRVSQDPQVFDKITLAGIVGLQPAFGGEERTESELRLTKAPVLNAAKADRLWRMFLPEGTDRNHPAVNVFGGGDDKVVGRMKSIKFPRSLVIVGGYDPLQDWQKRYVEGLKKCGKEAELIEYPNAFHGFYSYQELPEFRFFIEDVKKFIHKH